MRIEVTAEDIANGVRNDCIRCPVASAMRRTTGQLWSVTPSRMRGWDTHQVVYLDDDIHRAIIDFDDGVVIEPFTIRLEGNRAYRSDG